MKPYPSSLQGARVTVMGLGQFGGGLGVTRWLVAQGARVLLTDRDPEAKLAAPLAELAGEVRSGAVALALGGHEERDFAEADLVVANPAVPMPWENRYLRAARAAGVPVTTEIRLAIDGLDRERTLGITGSAGKSSTASMAALLLDSGGRTARLGGNIGGSLLGARAAPGEWTVLELSSAMLWWLGSGAELGGLAPWSPRVAVLTNLAPNHVDWHGSFGHYAASKAEIRRGQRPGDAFVTLFGTEQPEAAAAVARDAGGGAWWEGAAVPPPADLDALLTAIDLPNVPGSTSAATHGSPCSRPRPRSAPRARCRTAGRSWRAWATSARSRTGWSTWARTAACAATTTPRAPRPTPRSSRWPRSPTRHAFT